MIVLTTLPGVQHGEVKERHQKVLQFCYTHDNLERIPHTMQGHMGSIWLVMRQRERGARGKCLYYGFCGMEWVRYSKQA